MALRSPEQVSDVSLVNCSRFYFLPSRVSPGGVCTILQPQTVSGYTMGYYGLKKSSGNANMIAMLTVTVCIKLQWAQQQAHLPAADLVTQLHMHNHPVRGQPRCGATKCRGVFPAGAPAGPGAGARASEPRKVCVMACFGACVFAYIRLRVQISNITRCMIVFAPLVYLLYG